MGTATSQLNTQSMNMLIQQTAHDTPEARRIASKVPDDILGMVEQERIRRYQIIMTIPPLQFSAMCRNKLLPWM